MDTKPTTTSKRALYLSMYSLSSNFQNLFTNVLLTDFCNFQTTEKRLRLNLAVIEAATLERTL